MYALFSRQESAIHCYELTVHMNEHQLIELPAIGCMARAIRVACQILRISEDSISNYRRYVWKSDCKKEHKAILAMSEHLQLYNLTGRCLCKHRSGKTFQGGRGSLGYSTF